MTVGILPMNVLQGLVEQGIVTVRGLVATLRMILAAEQSPVPVKTHTGILVRPAIIEATLT